jgi:hypothetical protein
VILAKVPAARRGAAQARRPSDAGEGERSGLGALLLHVPRRVDAVRWGLRVALLAALALWGLLLVRQDYRTGEMGSSFLHGPLLVFHETGHPVPRLH